MVNGIIFISLLFISSSFAWSLRVENNVAPCSNGNYPTISIFATTGQIITHQGDVTEVDSSQISPYVGLGFQENGLYCRCCGNENGCINPDNAGMQLWVNEGNCESYQLNDPFYCGAHPPNAKSIVDLRMSGSWPNCVVTLTRRGDAPLCQYSC